MTHPWPEGIMFEVKTKFIEINFLIFGNLSIPFWPKSDVSSLLFSLFYSTQKKIRNWQWDSNFALRYHLYKFLSSFLVPIMSSLASSSNFVASFINYWDILTLIHKCYATFVPRILLRRINLTLPVVSQSIGFCPKRRVSRPRIFKCFLWTIPYIIS